MIPDPNAVKAYTGVIADPERRNFTEAIEHQRLAPKPRMYSEDWIEGHNKQKQRIAAGEVKKLVIGDSIVKHLDKAPVVSKPEWMGMSWCNAGLSGDCLENVHRKINDWVASKNVERIILAAGTNMSKIQQRK